MITGVAETQGASALGMAAQGASALVKTAQGASAQVTTAQGASAQVTTAQGASAQGMGGVKRVAGSDPSAQAQIAPHALEVTRSLRPLSAVAHMESRAQVTVGEGS